MSKRTKLQTAVELVKDVVILLLMCSAVWMLAQGGLSRLLAGRDMTRTSSGQSTISDRTEFVSPVRMTATLRSLPESQRCSIQYDIGTVDMLFQQTAGLLVEALSSAEQPRQISRTQWEQALGCAPGLCFDFMEEMPLSVLSGWMDTQLSLPDVTVSRIVLAGEEDQTRLYYCDMETGGWYRCDTAIVGTTQLENALSGLSANGAFYAFETEWAEIMDPDTLLRPVVEPMQVFTASNPVSGGRTALEQIMSDLGFQLSGCLFYSGAGEEVGRSGSDTLRLSKDGVVEYHTDEGRAVQFPVMVQPGCSEAFSAAEACANLLRRAMNERCGQARVHLARMEKRAEGWDVEFEYSLNGVPVSGGEHAAARFEVRGGFVTAFSIRLRNYVQSEMHHYLLPPEQAAAAMDALCLEGEALYVTYRDMGEESVFPNWTAGAPRVG